MGWRRVYTMRHIVSGLAAAVFALGCARVAVADPAAPSAATIFNHGGDGGWWLSGQLNVIGQAHGRFPSPYEGPNSLRAAPERALSRVWTIHAGVRVAPRTDVLVHVESAGGSGLSSALGVAGFTNLDVVRNPSLGSAPYIGRALVHYTHPLSHDTVGATRGPFVLDSRLPARRLELRVGKMSLADVFDVNAVGSDSHLQFMNWTIANNGAWDYAADTRGYTYALTTEWINPRWTVRSGEALMPTVANGITLDWHLRRSRGENLELELRPTPQFIVRLLGFENHARMGSYREAIAAVQHQPGARPDIEAHRSAGRIKRGLGVNGEYALASSIRLFTRAGWNGGDTESYAYTEVHHTVSGGGDVTGEHWRRPADRLGVAVAANGLSPGHREYLRLGGLGFLLGDGTLRYGRETVLETYYNAHLWRGAFAAAGASLLVHPGYNRDRGPAGIGSVRLHLDF